MPRKTDRNDGPTTGHLDPRPHPVRRPPGRPGEVRPHPEELPRGPARLHRLVPDDLPGAPRPPRPGPLGAPRVEGPPPRRPQARARHGQPQAGRPAVVPRPGPPPRAWPRRSSPPSRSSRSSRRPAGSTASEQCAWSAPSSATAPARDIALVALLLHTGLRVAELAALRWTDLEIRDRSGKLTVRRGKGRKQRTIPLNVEARNALIELREIRDRWGKFKGTPPSCRASAGR